MSGVTFEAKCLALQTIYLHLRQAPMFEDFAYQYGFETCLADTIASGQMIELASGGIKVVEDTYDALMEWIAESENPEALKAQLLQPRRR